MSIEQMENEVIEPMERGFTLFRQAARSIPRAAFDPAALAVELEATPEAAHRWVRDETDLLPYAGTVRGAAGTLMERAGNSLDRVLLLDALFAQQGIENRRLVLVLLDEATVWELWNEWEAHGPRSFPGQNAEADFELEDVVRQVAEDTGADPETLARDLRDARIRHEMLRAEMSVSVQLQAEILREALQIHTAEPGPEVVADLRHHWYLEAEIDGEWQSFDPGRRNHEPGDVLEGTVETRAPPDQIPEEWLHHLKIEVLAEQWKEGALEERTVLEHRFHLTELRKPNFTVQLVPPRDNPMENLIRENLSRAEILDHITRIEEWVPVLRVDDDTIIQFSILANGDINKDPEAAPTVRAMGDAVDALRGLGRGRREETRELTAVRLKITLDAPGREAESHSRSFTDILGPALREGDPANWAPSERDRRERALAMMGGITVMPLGHTPHPDWVNLQGFLGMLENREGFLSVVGGAMQGKMDEVDHGFGSLRRQPVDLYQIAMGRHRPHPQGNVTFADGVNLLARAETLRLSGDDDFIPMRSYDWIRNQTRPRPGVEDARAAVFLQGIVDTHVEDFLTRSDHEPETPRLNTARQFGEDLLLEMEWIRVTEPEALRQLGDQFSDDDRVRFRKMLAEGMHLLIRPETVHPFGDDLQSPVWWSLHPETGNLLGHALDGRGVSAEYAIQLASNTLAVITALIDVAICAGEEGWAQVCCFAVAVASNAIGMGIGSKLSGLVASGAVDVVTAYYVGVGYAAGAALGGGLVPCP